MPKSAKRALVGGTQRDLQPQKTGSRAGKGAGPPRGGGGKAAIPDQNFEGLGVFLCCWEAQGREGCAAPGPKFTPPRISQGCSMSSCASSGGLVALVGPSRTWSLHPRAGREELQSHSSCESPKVTQGFGEEGKKVQKI